MILLKGGYYLSGDGNFKRADILIEGEKIISIQDKIEQKDGFITWNFKGCRLIPGFIDIHMHGALGYDVMVSSPSQIIEIAEHLAREGTTSFFPTTITANTDEVFEAIVNIKRAATSNMSGASIEGVHIEGPYINPRQKGCHDIVKMKQPSMEEYKEFKALAGDLKIHMTVAPELNGSFEFIDYVTRNGGTISIGHSDACSDIVEEALKHGAGIFTHLFNGMKGIHHREPGVAGTALLSEAYVELICDGIHVHPDIIRLIHRLKGKDKIVLVTDAMQAKGLGDGRYQFGGFTVIVSNGIARMEDGTLASSTLSMFNAVKNFVKFTGVRLEEAINMASLNPAKAIGIDYKTGSLEVGKRADIVVIDDGLQVEAVFYRGKRV